MATVWCGEDDVARPCDVSAGSERERGQVAGALPVHFANETSGTMCHTPVSSGAAGEREVKRVCIVGAGAAGCAAAWSLIKSNRRSDRKQGVFYDVEVWEPAPFAGGVATTSHFAVSSDGDGERTVPYNDGVQGGAPSYRNTLSLLESLNHEVTKVSMKVCFGVDDEDAGSGGGEYRYWNNTGVPTETVKKHAHDIERFGRLLRFVYNNEPVFIAIKISWLLRLRGFSKSFGDDMVYPLVALFFGTGNQTQNVPAALIARVFLDPKLKLFDYHPETLLSQQPEMFAFPSFDALYASVVEFCNEDSCEPADKARTGTDGLGCFRFGRRCLSVSRDSSSGRVTVRGRQRRSDAAGGHDMYRNNPDDEIAIRGDGLDREGEEIEKEFDTIIFACSAENALKILQAGSGAGFFERQALGNVKYYNDVTITHTDYDYIMRHYSYGRLETINAASGTLADDPFHDKEMYLVRNYAHDRKLIEMSFDLSHYQPQIKYRRDDTITTRPFAGAESKSSLKSSGDSFRGVPAPATPTAARDADGSLFQTIFLDDKNRESWTIDAIDPSKVVKKKWWRQFAHTTGHYLGTVPFLRFIQNKKSTLYAGSWLTVNTHEQAVVSGLAAAYMISGDYFFDEDELAREQFDLFLRVIHAHTRKAGLA